MQVHVCLPSHTAVRCGSVQDKCLSSDCVVYDMSRVVAATECLSLGMSVGDIVCCSRYAV